MNSYVSNLESTRACSSCRKEPCGVPNIYLNLATYCKECGLVEIERHKKETIRTKKIYENWLAQLEKFETELKRNRTAEKER